MKLVSDQECDSLPRMSYTISLSSLFFLSIFFAHYYLQAHTLCLTFSLSPLWLCWRDNSVYRGDRLRQARLATYTEVWIYVGHIEKSALGTARAHFGINL